MAEKKKSSKKYEIGEWKGMKQYKCLLCPFDTLHRDVIEKHIAERHTPKKEVKKLKVPIYDRFGNLVTEREV